MTEQELSLKLTENESRARSNTRRIEKLERRQDDLNKLVTAESDVKEIKADVKSITEKPGRRWETLIDRVLYALIGAAVTFLMTGAA